MGAVKVDTRRIGHAAAIRRWTETLVRAVSHRHPHPDRLAFIGIHRLGVPLSKRLADGLGRLFDRRFPLGTLDITLYRDDLDAIGTAPTVRGTSLPFDLTGMHLILVDDILFTGRTIRAALDEIVDFGRPATVELAVLIDRGHREFPIQPDYVGHRLETARTETLRLHLLETDGEDALDSIQPSEGE